MEILVAMTLFALTASGLAAFAVHTLRRTSGNRSATGAVIAAQHEMEDLRGLDYPAVASRSYATTIGGLPYGVATSVVPDAPAAGMKQVTVTVGWSEPLGTQSYVVGTILTQIH